MTDTLRIATRRSALAMWQAEHVAALLRARFPGLSVRLVPMTTRGDRELGRSLAKIGGKGLFIKELEIAIEQGRADLAVHSMKDVPVDMPDGFVLAAILERANPDDVLVSNRFSSFAELPDRARLGTSSLRRQSQLSHARPDLAVEPLRGNVNTRLERLDAGRFDAIVLAAAGLERLGLAGRIAERLPHSLCTPAIGQGAIGIECLADASSLRERLAAVDDQATRRAVEAERALSAALGGSCTSPIAGYATARDDGLSLTGVVALPDGSRLLRASAIAARGDTAELGASVAADLLKQGAADLLRAAEGAS